MSFSAGAICKFNCCQEGRDLPQDNLISPSLCDPHFFLIISTKSDNDIIHIDWSKLLLKSEKDKIKSGKMCTAIPIDIINVNERNNPVLYFLNEDDYIDFPSLRGRSELHKLKSNHNAILCNKICKVNVNQNVSDTICYLNPDAFGRVITAINNALNRSKRELEIQITKLS